MSSQRDPEAIETQMLYNAADLSGTRVLEIGCGDGRLTWRYAAGVRHVTAIDLDPQRLTTALHDRASLRHDNVNFSFASVEKLPFSHTSFDRAIFAWSL